MCGRRRIPTLRTQRLRLRPWCEEDREPFAVMNADERVAAFLPSTLDRAGSDALAEKIEAGFERDGFGFWAVELLSAADRPFIGFIGLSVPSFDAPFTPCVEIGWRLSPEHWGLGLATEGARAVVRHGFDSLGLDEIVAFTVPENAASRGVMRKNGMRHDPADDFDHPRQPAGHALSRHVLYRIARSPERG